jgi:tetratricopeptide (TPR) repeat protein
MAMMNSKFYPMKKGYLMIVSFLLVLGACTQQDFEEAYFRPSGVAETSVEQQFEGFLIAHREYVIPSYWNYFVVMRPTVNRYTQVVGWVNAPGQYVPGGGLISDRWNNFYNAVGQYKDFVKVYSAEPVANQEDRRIYMIAATIFYYDATQKVVDIHGDIPWSQAGLLSTFGGDYQKALPAYDQAQDIYTKMLDDLKAFADELNTITVKPGVATFFQSQDIINNGSIDLWKRYCNSLRMRMLMRVSDVPAFQVRVASEMDEILANPAEYPVITANSQNVQIDIHNIENNQSEGFNLNSTGFQSGLEDWGGNIAGKAMIDNMKSNTDPRLRVMFEPGASAGGVYNGLDPMLNATTQEGLFNGGTMAIYNRSTLSRNDYFPGILMNAAEVYFLIAEYQLRDGNDAAAKTAYNAGIEQSIREYYSFRALSNDNVSGAVTPLADAEITAYQDATTVDWDNAANDDEKLELIATQKWLHYSVVQPMEGWAELRRMDVLDFNFEVDNSNAQTLPPARWLYAASENVFNAENYNAVRAKDNLTTKIFWDVQ